MSENKKKQKKKRLFPRILIVLSLIIALYFALMLFRQPIKTETVQYGSIENKVSCKGYVLFDEYVINSGSDGVLSCIAGEGTRVSAYTKVASVIKGKVDETLWGKINQINAEIAELEETNEKELIINDEASADSVMESTIEALIDSMYDNDMEMISQYRDEIQRVIAYKSGNGSEAENTLTKLEQLKNEKYALENSAGSEKEDITAPIAGMFSSKIDGYENAVDLKKLSEINGEVIKKLDEIKLKVENQAVAGEPVVKIMNNYEWYFVTQVEERWLNGLEKGSFLSLSFTDAEIDDIDVKVEAINAGEEGKKTVVVSSTKNFNDVYLKRKAEASLIRRTYNGFKISKEAVHVKDDGIQGVYVVRDGLATFREIDILYSGDTYVIAAENNQKQNGVLLYDEVILSPGVEEGDVV